LRFQVSSRSSITLPQGLQQWLNSTPDLDGGRWETSPLILTSYPKILAGRHVTSAFS
jgi:hypothetical protein